MGPIIGVGVIIGQRIDGKKKVLIGKRIGGIVGDGTFGFPGGKLDKGETIFKAAKREVKEETNLKIKKLKMIGFTQDFFEDGSHFITFFVSAQVSSGKLKNMEPQKCEGRVWKKREKLPKPLFLPIKNFKKGKNFLRD